ncbi:MAG: hypothetical protein DHS20C02_12640 [Micavibrio sp.]|nr:MAG: hypothetical protein DHS20C02_12640 [Micavibrio sp.]
MPVYYFVLDDAEALPPYRISELGGKEMVYSSEELKMYIRSGRLYETFKDNKCQVGFEQHEVTRQMYLYLPSDIPVFEDDYSLGTKKNFDQLALFLALLSTKGQKPLLDLEQDKPEIIEAYGNAQVLGRAQILAKGISGNHIAPDPEDPEPQAWSEYAINW